MDCKNCQYHTSDGRCLYFRGCPYKGATDADARMKEQPMDKPVMGVKPYFVAIPERITELSESIARHASCQTGIVELWAKEISLLSKLLRDMEREES